MRTASLALPLLALRAICCPPTRTLARSQVGSRCRQFAWVLGQCDALTSLSLADCNIEADGADELLEALSDPDAKPSLRSLDLRWNQLDASHVGGNGISADARVDVSGQKQKSAEERQTAHLEQTWQEAKAAKAAKAAGKKAPPPKKQPKWVREQQAQQQARNAASQAGQGTGDAMG